MIDEAINGTDSTVPSRLGVHTTSCRREPGRAQLRRRWPNIVQLTPHLLIGQRCPPAGNRFKFVERAASVTEPPAGHLRHRHSAGGNQRRERQRDLVSYPARRVLVDLRLPTSGKSTRSPELIMASVQQFNSRFAQAAKPHRHGQR
jgi:hypothetical protein